MTKYRSLPYHGGKRGNGKAEWIASNLPWEKDSCYIEPFAGMLGVLLARKPVALEVVNDLNGRVVNWWRAVRDNPEEFARLVEFTPFSRSEFDWARQNLDNPDIPPIRKALAFHVVVHQGMNSGDGHSGWRVSFASQLGQRGLFRGQRIIDLSERIREVHLENRDACEILERAELFDNAVIYADPPYPTADTSSYAVREFDSERLAELLQAQRGAVAVSGYGAEWDMLGWRKVTKAAVRRNINGNGSPRTEVLWLNDKAAQVQPQMMLEVAA